MWNNFDLEHIFFWFCPKNRYILIVDFVNENGGSSSLKLIVYLEQEASK